MLFGLVSGYTQDQITTEEYIEIYKDVAIKKMQEYQIPASITLAQGILESGNGNSRLAKRANNHFGIKCHQGWEGRKFFMDDDEKHECFRKYKHPSDSYRDHSLFLTNRDRYDFLFEYEITDYKSWAYGLKKAGYATNPKYPQLLINIIEKNKLAQYDKGIITRRKHRKNGDSKISYDTSEMGVTMVTATLLDHLKPVSESATGRKIYENNGIKFIRANAGDTYYILADEFNMYSWQFFKYNEAGKKYIPQLNEIVYLEKKKKKANKKFKKHIVSSGESLRDISQLYGIKLSSLMKLNGLETDRNMPVGSVLKLR